MVDNALKKAVITDIAMLKFLGLKPVIVHGGWKEISALLAKMGKESIFVDGLRYTDKETADVAEMVLSGTIGKNLVKDLESIGIHACSINGKDGSTFITKKKEDKNAPKIFDHRQKTGILSQINDYLSNKDLDIVLWAKTAKIKESFEKYINLKENILIENKTHKGIMFFDYPSSNEELNEILEQIKPTKIHFMNYKIDENIEVYIKQLQGMIKYCANKLNGKLDLERISQALGVSENFIQISLEIMENIEAIRILDVDKIEYLKAFGYEQFKNESMFEILLDEFNKIIEFKQNLLNCKIEELEKYCFN